MKRTPSPERISKAQTAAAAAAKELARHPECEYNPGNTVVSTNPKSKSTVVTTDLLFDKNGTHIFINPHMTDSDFDYPELKGREILRTTLERTARNVGLRLGDSTKPYIAPSQKGWVDIGYQFIY